MLHNSAHLTYNTAHFKITEVIEGASNCKIPNNSSASKQFSALMNFVPKCTSIRTFKKHNIKYNLCALAREAA